MLRPFPIPGLGRRMTHPPRRKDRLTRPHPSASLATAYALTMADSVVLLDYPLIEVPELTTFRALVQR